MRTLKLPKKAPPKAKSAPTYTAHPANDMTEDASPEAASLTVKGVLNDFVVPGPTGPTKLYDTVSVSVGANGFEVVARVHSSALHVLASKCLLLGAHEHSLNLTISARLFVSRVRDTTAPLERVGYVWVFSVDTTGSVVRAMGRFCTLCWSVSRELISSGGDKSAEFMRVQDSLKIDFLETDNAK